MRRIWGGGGAGGLSVNDVLMKDARLSVPARGLAVHLLLLPESAQPDLVRFASRPGESAESIAGYLEELEEVGYLRRRIVYDRSGRAFEEVTVFGRADAGEEASDVRGRVFHWLATPESERRSAEASGEAAGDAAADEVRAGPRDDSGDDDQPSGDDDDAGDAAGDAVDEAVDDVVDDAAGDSEGDRAEGDLDDDLALPEPEPAGAGVGGGRGSGDARP